MQAHVFIYVCMSICMYINIHAYMCIHVDIKNEYELEYTSVKVKTCTRIGTVYIDVNAYKLAMHMYIYYNTPKTYL